MMENKAEKRCKTCKRIIVGENKTGICPDCARKGKNGAMGILGTLGSIALLILTKGRKK